MEFPKVKDMGRGIKEIESIQLHLIDFAVYPFIGFIWTVVAEICKGYGVGDGEKKFGDPMTKLAVQMHFAMYMLAFFLIGWLSRSRAQESNMDKFCKAYNSMVLFLFCGFASAALPFCGVYAQETEPWTWQSFISFWFAVTLVIAALRIFVLFAYALLQHNFKEEKKETEAEE